MNKKKPQTMAYYSNFNKQVNKGNESETIFKKTAKREGFKVTKATGKQNKTQHIDFILDISGSIATVDVKTIGKYGFTAEVSNNWGGLGSMYGQQDYIAYVDKDKIYLVEREKLAKLVESKLVDGDVINNSSKASWMPEPYYKLFRRMDFKWMDLWVMVKTHYMMSIVTEEWSI